MADLMKMQAANDFSYCKANYVMCEETACEFTTMWPFNSGLVANAFICLYYNCGCTAPSALVSSIATETPATQAFYFE